MYFACSFEGLRSQQERGKYVLQCFWFYQSQDASWPDWCWNLSIHFSSQRCSFQVRAAQKASRVLRRPAMIKLRSPQVSFHSSLLTAVVRNHGRWHEWPPIRYLQEMRRHCISPGSSTQATTSPADVSTALGHRYIDARVSSGRPQSLGGFSSMTYQEPIHCQCRKNTKEKV